MRSKWLTGLWVLIRLLFVGPPAGLMLHRRRREKRIARIGPPHCR
ncbi:MAG: hypothetical protein NTU53_08020 [Planctomycetota bacterium]|nr:hypothetical protein [Planctomycetota bacterium]